MSQGFVPPPYGAPQFQPPHAQGAMPVYQVVPVAGQMAPAPWAPVLPVTGPPQRPAVIGLAATLAVTASLQWICGLSLIWVTAAVGSSTFDQLGDNGAIFHILRRFEDRMLDGLALPLFLFPLASLVTGFLVLSQRPWTRLAHTVVGLAALAWAAWWLQDNLLWWFSAAWYVVLGCLVLWTPGATAWYRWRRDERPPPLG
ncbi:hypothetical protein [uncultured Friedmanniella sp.]|uniref:hypothetical protein n=1 Tax=uncultured Friedmanniella sp. TaxID=335381 RepID=UPI0035CB9AF5